MDTIKVNFKNIIAHRGLSALERENTASAFVAAGNRKNYGIETDVHVTLDGKYVIIHNDDTEQVAGVNLPVEGSCFNDLRALRLLDTDGTKDRGDLIIPTVTEYIRICKRYEKHCFFEFKNAFKREQIAEICDFFIKEDYIEHTTFISFVYENLLALRELYPAASAQFLTGEMNDEVINRCKKDNLGLDVEHHAITKETVEAAHAAGLEVNTWTVDAPEDAERVISCGVDYITSNVLEYGE